MPATVTVSTTLATPVPTATPYPGALSLNQPATFGKADRTGKAIVYKAELRSNYSWSSPSFNSAHEQAQAGAALGTQQGYNTQEPAAGNTFLFTYIRITGTGTTSLVAPSPNQFTVNYDGKNYAYSSVRGSDVTVGTVRVPQYDYTIGTGGVAGYVQPGDSNAADGFLIFEVPESTDLSKAALVITLDSDNKAAWKLA